MNVTWNEAAQIVEQMIREECLFVDAHTQERMASVIFSHRDEAWDEHDQQWIKAGGGSTNPHVNDLQEEREELHRKLKLTRDRCTILEEELARMRATNQLVQDSENLRHIVNKLDSLNVPKEVDGEPLVLPVDRMVWLIRAMRSRIDATQSENHELAQKAIGLDNEIERLQGYVEGLNEALKLRVRQADKMSGQIEAIQRIVT